MPFEKPEIIQNQLQNGSVEYIVKGSWTVHTLIAEIRTLDRQWKASSLSMGKWNLEQVTQLDSAGTQWLWQLWQQKIPTQIAISDSMAEQFHRLEQIGSEGQADIRLKNLIINALSTIGLAVLHAKDWFLGLVIMLGQAVLDIFYIFRHPKAFPFKELTTQIYHVGAKALTITALVGFLIGIVLSYLLAFQLKVYGADRLIVNLLSIATLRELGPLLAAILVAGRSGSAMTAQIGVMRLNQELDAMTVLGISRSRRLLLPRLLGLVIALPLLVLWTSSVALFGGAVGAWLQLDLPLQFFMDQLPQVTKLSHYWIGIAKGSVYGLLIALIACRYGLMIQPNTQSLGKYTTASVVSSITGIILANALFAIVFRGI